MISRPDADVCGINFSSDKPAHLLCFNMKDDFNDDGVLHAGVKPHIKPIKNAAQLNAGKYVSKEDWPKIQVWLQDLRDYSKNNCQ
jgi:hypothetical protein